jgi:hypothetical protein
LHTHPRFRLGHLGTQIVDTRYFEECRSLSDVFEFTQLIHPRSIEEYSYFFNANDVRRPSIMIRMSFAQHPRAGNR